MSIKRYGVEGGTGTGGQHLPFFGDNPPARICCVADLVVDCKVEVDVTCFNAARQ